MAGYEVGDTGQSGGTGDPRGGGGTTTTTTTTTAPSKPTYPKTYKAGSYGAFAVALFRALGVANPTDNQMHFLLAWMGKESGQGRFNPLGINYSLTAPNQWNASSFQAGVNATAAFLKEGQYSGMLQALRSANPNIGSQGVINSLDIWSGHNYDTFNTNVVTTGSAGNAALGTINWLSKGGGTPGPGGGGTGNNPSIDGLTLGPGTSKTFKDYLSQLTDWGVPVTPEVIGFAKQAAAGGWAMGTFKYSMEHQPWFQRDFPGIFAPDGTLRMDPSQYSNEFQSYQGIASQFGQNLSKQQFGYALNQNVDRTSFNNRMQAIQFVEANKGTFEQFEQTLKARGLLKGDLKKADMYRIAMGEAPPVWNKVWEEGYMRGAAVNAGLMVGRDISRHMVNQLIKEHPELYSTIQGGGSAAIQDQWYKLAQDVKTTLPASQLYGLGLTTADLAQLEFGGPKAADIAQRAQQALDNAKAANGPQAGTPLGALAARAGQSQTSTALASGVQSPFETP